MSYLLRANSNMSTGSSSRACTPKITQIPSTPLDYGDNVLDPDHDTDPLEAIQLDLDSEEDSAIIDSEWFYDQPLIDAPSVNGPSYKFWNLSLPVMANLYRLGRTLLSESDPLINPISPRGHLAKSAPSWRVWLFFMRGIVPLLERWLVSFFSWCQCEMFK